MDDSGVVTLSHGSGGRAMAEFIENVFLASYGSEEFSRDDSAVLDLSGPIAFTTDSYVVDPIFFPGGDIGRLSISGTANDLLSSAARPAAMSVSFVIEEGFPIGSLRRIAVSMRDTAAECGARIVTGDTKVVPRNSADKIFITTSGIGVVMLEGVSGSSVKPGDKIILSGSIGDHGVAVMLAREHLLEAEDVVSDAAPLSDMVMNLIESGCRLHAMRDPTRGGISSALNEIARQSHVCMEIDESAIVIKPIVRTACEALGIEPFCVANEGKMLLFLAPDDAETALDIIRRSRYGAEAAIIGEVRPLPQNRVQLKTVLGTTRILRSPVGELLPRIC